MDFSWLILKKSGSSAQRSEFILDGAAHVDVHIRVVECQSLRHDASVISLSCIR